jgi:alpha-glucoside transport system permease protein
MAATTVPGAPRGEAASTSADARAAALRRSAKGTVPERIGRAARRAPLRIFLFVVAVLWLVPTLGLFFTSLMPADLISQEGWWKVFAHPSLATFSNYNAVLHNNSIMRALWTTVEISVGNTVLLVLISSMAGYAFAWLKFPGRDWLFILVIALLVVPLQTALIPIFSLYEKTGLFDTVLGLILFHVAFGLPFGIFLMRNFFVGIPKDILESARIDGASELTIFFRLMLPLALPAIASLAIFQFLWTWNDLLVALTYGRNTQPITVAIFTQLRQFGTNIELIAPASFLSMLIPLAVFFAFQRYFAQGLLAGSVK